MRALCVLHDHVSTSGYVGTRLRELGWDVNELVVVPANDFNNPNVACDFPPATGYDLLVPLGAPWSAYDDDHIGRWLSSELAWLGAAVANDVPVFGICFGAQALARVLGGDVRPATRPEIGWVDVDTDEPALVATGPWFQWHYDEFTIPPGAREIARSPVCSQAFRHGRSLGVQFHPELTLATLDRWLRNGGEQQARSQGLDSQALRRTLQGTGIQVRNRSDALVDAFLSFAFATARSDGNDGRVEPATVRGAP